jgi:hypothetical protein
MTERAHAGAVIYNTALAFGANAGRRRTIAVAAITVLVLFDYLNAILKLL